MAWKTIVPVTNPASYQWNGSGLPDVQTLLVPTRGLFINIPSASGGVSTFIADDLNTIEKLRDGDITSYMYYTVEGTTYPVLFSNTGNSIGLQFTTTELIGSIKIYTAGSTNGVLGANTFYVLASNDGTNWYHIETMLHTDVVFETFPTYSVITFLLTQPIHSKYIAVRALNALDVTTVNGEYIREMEVFTPDGNFGTEGDVYENNETGKKYKKINNSWQLVFTPTPVPVHMVGDTPILPSGVGLPDGSIYFVRGGL